METIGNRTDFVGKRIITFTESESSWEKNTEDFKVGVIRCTSSLDVNDIDFKLCVEWLNLHWEDREWIKLQECAKVYIEDRIVLAPINHEQFPVLLFSLIKGDEPSQNDELFAEYFHDHQRVLLDEAEVTEVSKRAQLEELPIVKQDQDLNTKLSKWINLQGCQQLLKQSESTLVGTWVLVYWHSSSLQWKNAMITSQNKDGLMVMTEQVLTETFVDPSITQVKFVDKNFLSDFWSQKLTRSSRRKGRNSFPAACLHTISRRSSIGKRKSSLNSINYGSEQNLDYDAEHHEKISMKHSTAKRTRSKTIQRTKSLTKRNSDLSKHSELIESNDLESNSFENAENRTRPENLEQNLNEMNRSSPDMPYKVATPTTTDQTTPHEHVNNSTLFNPCDKLNILAKVATDKMNFDLRSEQESSAMLPPPLTNHCPDIICKSAGHRTVTPDRMDMNPAEETCRQSVLTSSSPVVLQESMKAEQTSNTVKMSSVPNLVGGNLQSSFSVYKKPEEVNSGENKSAEMQNSQHARTLHALAARQALMRQQQQQQQHLAQVAAGQSPHLLAYAPYPFPILYGNPSAANDMSNLMLANAQSQISPAELASNPLFAQQLLTQSQNAVLSKSFSKDYLMQQQALYALLHPGGLMDGGMYPGHSVYRPPVSPGGNSRTATPKSLADHQALLSAQDGYREKLHRPSDSPSSHPPQRSPPFHPRTPSIPPQRSPSSHKGSPAPPRRSPLQQGIPPAMHYVKEHLEERKRKAEEKSIQEENWRLMEKRKFQIADVEKQIYQNLDQSRSNPFHHNNAAPAKDPKRAPNQMYMMDPATYVATHPVKYISSEVGKPLAPTFKDSISSMEFNNNKAAPVNQSMASSSKVWQPPVQGGSLPPKEPSPKRVNKNPAPQNWGNSQYLHSNAMQPPQSQPSNVFNIHSLKYSPSGGNQRTPPVSPKIKHERGVIVKTSQATGPTPNRELPGNNVKYIKENNLAQHKLDREESLGPLMPDGSRARILTPDSLMHLHHFPSPLAKAQSKPKAAEKPNNSVIINGGHYKVTAVHNNADKMAANHPADSQPPNHVVYVKPNPEPLEATDLSVKRTQIQNSDPPKKEPPTNDVKSQPNSLKPDVYFDRKQEPAIRSNVVQPSNGTAKNYLTESYLKNMPQHMLPMITKLTQTINSPETNLVWNDPYSMCNSYPGAPSKESLKDALLGVMKSSSHPAVNPTPSVIKAVSSASDLSTSSEKVVKLTTPVSAPSKPSTVATAKSSQPSSDSDVSSISDLSTTSTNIPAAAIVSKTKPPEAMATKMPCAKMKKAWLQRLPEENVATDKPVSLFPKPLKRKSIDETIDSVVTNMTEHNSTLPAIVENSPPESDPPSKKQKKKHKSKDKDRKSKDPSRKKKNKAKNKIVSNSQRYLLGVLNDNSNEGNDNEEKCKKKAKPAVEMPLGENGLPVSILLCAKEQARLKKTGESFLQDAACYDLLGIQGITLYVNNGATTLPKCRECRHTKSKENSVVFCRFYGFRKLSFINGLLQSAGFCDPEDSIHSDLSLWLPKFSNALKSSDKNPENTNDGHLIESQACMYIMRHICQLFFEVVQKEMTYMKETKEKFSWKRPISGVREMCDVCDTTLFNMHWVCQICGFGVCCDCHKARSLISSEDAEMYDSDRNNSLKWFRCTKGKFHKTQELMPTQIIPSTCMFDLCDMVHSVKEKWVKKIYNSASLTHKSSDPTPLLKNHCNNELLSKTSKPEARQTNSAPARDKMKGYDCESSASPLDWLASIALRDQKKSKVNGVDEKTVNGKTTEKPAPLNRVYTDWSHAPLSTLCHEILQLTDSTSKVNIDSFQQQWVFAWPVIVSGSEKCLNSDLWKPGRINEEHGDEPTRNALVNCRLGSVITNACIGDFWSGFECIENRLCDEKTGEKLILKLKDWPTTEDFIDTMPERFDDLMKALPISQYTGRDGKFNITAYLPDFFARPDLGPKMYIAYGWASEKDWCNGTTNLHLDISDACNLMVYVGIPQDSPPEAQSNLIEIMKEGDVDDVQIERVKNHKPGALWHIFKPSDTDKIRQLIIKVKKEKCLEFFEDHDPIHDQQIYLDRNLRKRLLNEYGVKGYPIVQCEGDSVFIPAGAPHQVFNLHSCIKVAEDFVSPEHVNQCSKLMEEFRHLSKNHSNSEDKLQLKNILYHCMKEVVSSLNYHEANGAVEIAASNPR